MVNCPDLKANNTFRKLCQTIIITSFEIWNLANA